MDRLKRLIHTPWGAWVIWAVITLCYFYPLLQLDYHHDEGFYAEQAVRVLRGDLPNVDFATNYIGGFTYYNALWFLLLGKSFFALRMGMLFLLIFFIPTVYTLCRKLMPVLWASLTTLMVMAITVSMAATVSANWYGLFMVTFAFALFLKTVDAEKCPLAGRWLFVSGVLLGLASLLKQTMGLYAGFAFFFMIILDEMNKAPLVKAPSQSMGSMRTLQIIITLGLLSIVPLFFYNLLTSHLSLVNVLMYFVPVFLVSVVLGLGLLKKRETVAFLKILQRTGFLIGGGAVPILLYLIPFLLSGSLGQLWDTLFIKWPFLYLHFWYQAYELLLKWPVFLLLFWIIGSLWLLDAKPKLGWLFLLFGCFALGQDALHEPLQWSNAIVYSITQLPLWFMAGGAVFFVSKCLLLFQSTKIEQKTFLAMSLWLLGLFLFLITYPFTIFTYVVYSMLPFVILMGYWMYGGFSTTQQPIKKGLLASLLGMWILFGALFGYGQVGVTDTPSERQFPHKAFIHYLPFPRGGLYLTSQWFETLQPVLGFIQKYSTRPDDVFLFSDGPEFYFLTDHQNPTRYSHAYLSYFSNGADIVADLERHRVRYVIFDVDPKIEPVGQDNALQLVLKEKRPRFHQNVVGTYISEHFRLKPEVRLYGFIVMERKS